VPAAAAGDWAAGGDYLLKERPLDLDLCELVVGLERDESEYRETGGSAMRYSW